MLRILSLSGTESIFSQETLWGLEEPVREGIGSTANTLGEMCAGMSLFQV